MSGVLSGTLDDILSNATYLPLPMKVASYSVKDGDTNLTENEITRKAELNNEVHTSYTLQEFDAYAVPYSDETLKDELFGNCNMNLNVAMTSDITFNEISTTSQPRDTIPLQRSLFPDSSEMEHDSPLKTLIKSSPGECDEANTTRRKRRSKHIGGEHIAQREPVANAEDNFGAVVTQDPIYVALNPPVSCVSIHTLVDSNAGLDVKKKRTRKREVNPDRSPPPQIIPPCRVCEEKSSGFHYGANTCEACKGFFRRTLKKKEVTFQCRCSDEERAAWKRGPYKNGCQACRYERCLCVGMSKNAIKIGRYTLMRKTKNIKEVKSLEDIDTLIQDAIVEATNDSSVTDSLFYENLMEGVSPLTSQSMSSSEPPIKKQKIETTDEDSQTHAECSSTELTLKEIDTTVKTIVDAQAQNLLVEPRNMDTLPERWNKCMEEYSSKTAVFGNMAISNTECLEFYRTTGLHLDNRYEDINQALTFFESRISRMVGFAKSIPGFKQLDIDDQIHLIKESRVESGLIGSYRFWMARLDPTHQVVTTPWGKEYHINDVCNVLPKEIILRRRELAQDLLKLDLTAQEDAVLRAMVVIAPDRCDLNSPEKAEEIQIKLVSCLQHLLSVRPDGTGNKLYKIFNLLAKLREFSEYKYKMTKKIIQEIPNFGSNFQLLSEFLR